MKNNFCDLSESEIEALQLPSRYQGLLLSAFQHVADSTHVHVPLDTFKEFTNAVVDLGKSLQQQAEAAKRMEAVNLEDLREIMCDSIASGPESDRQAIARVRARLIQAALQSPDKPREASQDQA